MTLSNKEKEDKIDQYVAEMQEIIRTEKDNKDSQIHGFLSEEYHRSFFEDFSLDLHRTAYVLERIHHGSSYFTRGKSKNIDRLLELVDAIVSLLNIKPKEDPSKILTSVVWFGNNLYSTNSLLDIDVSEEKLDILVDRFLRFTFPSAQHPSGLFLDWLKSYIEELLTADGTTYLVLSDYEIISTTKMMIEELPLTDADREASLDFLLNTINIDPAYA